MDVAASRAAETSTGTTPVKTNAPIKTITQHNVAASIFVREHNVRGELRRFYSVSFTRSYKDAAGQYKYAKSFDLEDLGALVTVAQQASEYLHDLLNSGQDASEK